MYFVSFFLTLVVHGWQDERVGIERGIRGASCLLSFVHFHAQMEGGP